METNKIYQGDCLEVLKTFSNESINCVMTSPPYWALRDYGVKGQLGLESSFKEYIKKLCEIFDEVKRVLKTDGTCWVNLGDTYYSVNGGKYLNDNISSAELNIKKDICDTNKFRKEKELPQKSLCNIPARFSIEMQEHGWILRNIIIWHKPNCMPSSIKDRFTADFEYLFFFVKSKKYYFETQYEQYTKPLNRGGGNKFNYRVRDVNRKKGSCPQFKATKEEMEKYAKSQASMLRDREMRPNIKGRRKRSIWLIPSKPFKGAHFATFPESLCETPLKAGCKEGDIVLDPFFGAGTTGLVALKLRRKFIGIELNQQYIDIANKRLKPYITQQRLI
jgi:site-specific DNA-methyltransferase (adenine-specific)